MAVEVREPKGYGRCRLQILPDASAASLHPFVADHVEPGATVVTDAWSGYDGIEDLGYTRQRYSQRAVRLAGGDPYGLLPGVHRIASLAKRWLLGTHQGSVDPTHLQAYLDEFVFRFSVVIKAVVVVVGEGGARGGNPLWTMGTRWRASRSACGPLREGSTRRCSDGSGATRRLEECRSSQSRVCVRSPHGLCAA